jgi:hypothetical protein
VMVSPTDRDEPFDLNLLMGLDLPVATNPADLTLIASQHAADAALRERLIRAGRSFVVIYGLGADRLTSSLCAINSIAKSVYQSGARGQFRSKFDQNWAWDCDKCSDAQCEHRLFTRLLT